MAVNKEQAIPQLFMRNSNITTLPPLCLPKGGMSLHTHDEGKEKDWENRIEEAYGYR